MDMTVSPVGRPAVADVERLLGTPLFPEGIEPLPDQATPEGIRSDIRLVAFAAGSLALTGKMTRNTLTGVSDELVLPTAERLDWLAGQVKVANNITLMAQGRGSTDTLQHVRASLIVPDQDMIRQYLGEIGNDTFRRFLQEAESTQPETDKPSARDLMQGKALESIYNHTQTLPQDFLTKLGTREWEELSDNLLVVAPTGLGKTVLQARFLGMAGIGADTNDMSQVIGSFWQNEKSTEHQVVASTPNSLETAIESGLAIDRREIGVLDEAHIGLSPTLERQLDTFSRLYCFTATPAYSADRSMRDKYRTIDLGTLCDCIDQRILSDASLYSFMAKSMEHAEEIAIKSALKDALEGRRVIVYCKPGDKTAQAGWVAAEINRYFRESGGTTDIASEYNGEMKNRNEILQKYYDHDLSVLVTTNMLAQGYDGPGDTGIFIGNSTSILQYTQRVGRFMRPGDFDAKLIEILLPTSDGRVTIWNVFGLEEIRQGMKISRRNSQVSQQRKPKIYDIPEGLESALLVEQPVSRITISYSNAKEQHAVENGYISTSEFMERYHTSRGHIHKLLDDAKFSYIGVRLKKEHQDNPGYVRYYQPEASEYLASHRPTPLRDMDMLTAEDLALLCDVAKKSIVLMAEKMDVTQHEALGKNHRPARFFDREGIRIIKEAIDAIPYAEETDITTGTLCEELSESFVRSYIKRKDTQIKPIYKRRNPIYGIKGFEDHLSFENAEEIRTAYHAVAGPEHVAITTITEEANITKNAIRARMFDTEIAQIVSLRPDYVTRSTDHVPRDVAQAILDRLPARGLPVNRVPLSIVLARIPLTRIQTLSALDKLSEAHKKNYTPEVLTLDNATKCISWEALEALEKQYGLLENVTPIDYSKVAKNVDCSKSEWEYSTAIQARYVKSNFLSELSNIDGSREVRTFMHELGLPEYAFPVLLSYVSGAADNIRSVHGKLYIRRDFAEKMSTYTINQAPRGWISHRYFVQQNRFKSNVVIETANSVPGSKSGRRICSELIKEKNQIDVWYSPELAHIIKCQIIAQGRTMGK